MKRLLILLALFASMPLHAGNGALTVTPAVVQLRGSFGQSTTQRMTITNGTGRTLAFELVAEDVVVKYGARVFVPAGETAGSIATTAVFSQRRVNVAPGGTEVVDVTFTIPGAARHRAVVALFRGTVREHVNASVGTLFTFTLSDDVAVDAGALDVRPQSASSNLTVAQECTNHGSEPVVARGVAAVIDGAGKLVGRATLASRRLLPGETTTIAGEFAGELAPGRYKVLVTYDFEGRKSLTSSAETSVR